jgi:hypothetical protein
MNPAQIPEVARYRSPQRDHREEISSSHPFDGLPIPWLSQWQVPNVWNPSSLLEQRSHHNQSRAPIEIHWKLVWLCKC